MPSLDPNLFRKHRGDVVSSDDWNSGFAKVDDLDTRVGAVETGKVSKQGDTLTGPVKFENGVEVWGDFSTQAGLIAHQRIEARNGIDLVAGGINLPAASVAPLQLGLTPVPLVITIPKGRTVYIGIEQYPDTDVSQATDPAGTTGWGASYSLVPAFLRIVRVEDNSSPIEFTGEVCERQPYSGQYRITRGVGLACSRNNGDTRVHALVFTTPFSLGIGFVPGPL